MRAHLIQMLRREPSHVVPAKAGTHTRWKSGKNTAVSTTRTVVMGPGVRRDDNFYRPVEPKPPLPRSVSLSAAATTSSACVTGAMTICAIRSPRLIVKSVAP